MRVAVIGAGIVGVATAYELSADGHEVTVYERRDSVAAETSFANAGLVAPGYVTPWAAPGMPARVLLHLLSRHAAVRVHPNLSLAWAWKWWRACRTKTHQANRLRMQRLAYFSRDRLHELTQDLRLEYESRKGLLVLLRTPRDLARLEPGLATLTASGTRYEVLDAAGCRIVEPWLASGTALHAGIHLPDDEVGNCRQFALLLRRQAELRGARFEFDTTVQRVHAGPQPRVVHVGTPRPKSAPPVPNLTRSAPRERPEPEKWQDTESNRLEPISADFDAVVICAALGARALLRPLGVKLPLRAVYGYSLTAPLRSDGHQVDPGPRSALMDEHYKVAISRLGSRVRVAGSAELGGSEAHHHPGAIATLYKVLADWFPGAAQLGQVQHWKGARPMLPDGPPVLGASGIKGVWLNLGHGSSGWGLACGSARIVADAVAGRAPSIDVEGLGIERLRR